MKSFINSIPSTHIDNYSGNNKIIDYRKETNEIKTNLINQFNNFLNYNTNNEEKKIYTKIFQFFLEAENKLKNLKINYEEINTFLIEIFCDEPFINYNENFNEIIKNLTQQFTENMILNENKISFYEFLEQEIYNTKLPLFIINLIKIFQIENKLFNNDNNNINNKIKKANLRKSFKQEDWDFEKVINLLNSPKEKERLDIIIKNIEKELKPVPSFFKGEKKCEEEYQNKLKSFNIISYKKYYFNIKNNITICISGFLTEKSEHFSGWKHFIREDKEESNFYFLNWPSKSGMKAILSFNKVKKIANLFGKILANLIVSEKVFRNKKVTLIGHSLGCHFIKCCIKELAENSDIYNNLKNKIEKIIFLGGATQIKDNVRWYNILNKVIKGVIYNFYSYNDKALGVMQNFLVWGKNAIGKRALEIKNLNIKNYDCSPFKFEDILHHGYKEVYEQITNFYNL